jgi:hypothetical protein
MLAATPEVILCEQLLSMKERLLSTKRPRSDEASHTTKRPAQRNLEYDNSFKRIELFGKPRADLLKEALSAITRGGGGNETVGPACPICGRGIKGGGMGPEPIDWRQAFPKSAMKTFVSQCDSHSSLFHFREPIWQTIPKLDLDENRADCKRQKSTIATVRGYIHYAMRTAAAKIEISADSELTSWERGVHFIMFRLGHAHCCAQFANTQWFKKRAVQGHPSNIDGEELEKKKWIRQQASSYLTDLSSALLTAKPGKFWNEVEPLSRDDAVGRSNNALQCFFLMKDGHRNSTIIACESLPKSAHYDDPVDGYIVGGPLRPLLSASPVPTKDQFMEV